MLFLALQDMMIRYKRMKGFDTLWVPGTDHAARLRHPLTSLPPSLAPTTVSLLNCGGLRYAMLWRSSSNSYQLRCTVRLQPLQRRCNGASRKQQQRSSGNSSDTALMQAQNHSSFWHWLSHSPYSTCLYTPPLLTRPFYPASLPGHCHPDGG